MAEKTILTVDLYDNVLTEKANDFTGKVSITGTIHNSDIAERIVKARTEYRPETILKCSMISTETLSICTGVCGSNRKNSAANCGICSTPALILNI